MVANVILVLLFEMNPVDIDFSGQGNDYDSYENATVVDPAQLLSAPAGRGEQYATVVFGFRRRLGLV